MSDVLLLLTIGFAAGMTAGMTAGIVASLLMSAAKARREMKLREEKELAMGFEARE